MKTNLRPSVFAETAIEVDGQIARFDVPGFNNRTFPMQTGYCCNAFKFVLKDVKESKRYERVLAKYFKPTPEELQDVIKYAGVGSYKDYLDARGFWGRATDPDASEPRVIALLICAEIVKEQNRKKR